MLRRFFKPSEVRNYSVVISRSNKTGYNYSQIKGRDSKTVNGYVDTLMQYADLIPSGSDEVMVNLKETEHSLSCEVLPVPSKN